MSTTAVVSGPDRLPSEASPEVPGEVPGGVPAAAARPARRRRWPRAVAPFVVLALLYLVTFVAHEMQSPDLGDPGTLSPTGTVDDGSSRLAGLLAARGVTVERVASSEEALTRMTGVEATVFIPTPGLLRSTFPDQALITPGRHHFVVVRPGFLASMSWGAGRLSSRWASRPASVTSPGPVVKDVPPPAPCSPALVAGVRRASLGQDRLVPLPASDYQQFSCFGGGLVGQIEASRDVTVAGSADPFRNSRIGEYDNERLAQQLLSRERLVIWVDVHKKEPRPVKLELPHYHQPGRDKPPDGGLWGTLPPWLWAAFALVAAAGILVAATRAGRLGPPVAEPLPVVVPATETILGRGRLYRRVRAREATLATLRAAAVARLAAALRSAGQPVADPAALSAPDSPAADGLVTAVAARTGWSRDDVRTVLYGRSPVGAPPGYPPTGYPPTGDAMTDMTDDELAAAVATLDHLQRAVLREGTPGGRP